MRCPGFAWDNEQAWNPGTAVAEAAPGRLERPTNRFPWVFWTRNSLLLSMSSFSESSTMLLDHVDVVVTSELRRLVLASRSSIYEINC